MKELIQELLRTIPNIKHIGDELWFEDFLGNSRFLVCLSNNLHWQICSRELTICLQHRLRDMVLDPLVAFQVGRQ